MHKFAKLINIVGFSFLAVVLVMVVMNVLKKNLYDPKLGINILLITNDGIGIVAIRPDTGLVSLTQLPDNLLIQTDSTGASYQAEAFYKVGLPVKDANREAMVSVGQALGVALSAWVKTPSSFSFEGLQGSLTSLSAASNLSLLDRYRLRKELSSISGKKTVLSVTLPTSVTESEDEIDGQQVLKLNPAVFTWSRNQWVNDGILGEGIEVTVVNASGKEGKARQVAHQVESEGIRVIDLVSAKKDSERTCLLVGNTEIKSKTIDFLKKSFGCSVDKKVVLTDYLDRDAKSDLVMILGK